ncbi:uncharacterized protein DDB_G0283697-like [Chelonus insularis]|uniref:uncharacterized protein DDB_G0283697-like n=1 Tax=Chelonus insularis TaxID=460826 RepID=UPI0015889D71|nr:uncharacterized protein DDB_G0283697-like [Chelonus insularis]
MNSTRRLAIITLLTIVGSLVLTEARYHGDDSPRHRHRHRHEVSSLTARRNHESHRLEVDDDMKEDDEEDDEEDYYRPRHYQPRLEAPYRGRYHANMRHEVNFRHVEDAERRRRFGFNMRGHRTRPWSYKDDYTSRNHDIDPDDVQDDTEDYDDYERPPRWHYLDDEDSSRWRSYPIHRKTDYYFSHRDWIESRREWRARKADLDHRRKMNYQREAKRWYPDDDYDYDSVDEAEKNVKLEDGSRNKSKKFNVSEVSADDEEDSIWREAESAEDEDDSDKIDNDFFNDETSSSSRTYDNIIKRLTSNDPKTPKPPSVKRDYRNIEIEKYLQRDTYGNLKYEPKNTTKNFTRPSSGFNRTITKKEPTNNIKYLIAPSQKTSIFNLDNRKIEQKKLNSKILEPRAKIKNLEQEDEDYSEDRRVDIQSDVTIGDNTEEKETAENDAFTPMTPSPMVSKMTTTSSRPVITVQQNYDRRDSRLFSSTTPSHNELQSIHNSHKVQTKESRSQVYNNKNEKSEIREARLHAMKVSREGSCQWPRARVIPVRDVYPSPSTTYIPHCAILHRCSDDTGCCRSEALTCVPKKSHKVELYFYTTSIEGGNVVEKLSFYNHTECECREKSEYGITSDSRPSSVQETEFRSHPSRQQHQSAMPPQNIRRPPQKKPCRCPSDFTPRITLDGECQCNCYEENQNCIRARRGKGYFSLRDRLCIQNEECAVPLCEFGEYIKRQGRCPRKKDKFNEIANYPNHMNFNHRHRS